MTTKTQANELLIKLIRDNTPPGTNPVDRLIGIVPMSKEAAYRRLRGEIGFSFEEAVKISHNLRVSLDSIAGSRHTFGRNLQMVELGGGDDPVVNYLSSLESLAAAMRELSQSPDPRLSVVTNMLIPLTHILKFPTMSRFRMFRWMLRSDEMSDVMKMSDMPYPEDIARTERALTKAAAQLPTTYICGPDLMKAYLNDATYFYQIGLLSGAEVSRIKEEAMLLLGDLERDIARGEHGDGHPFLFYISGIHFDITCFLFRSDDFAAAAIQQFGLGSYVNDDGKFIENISKWESMLKNNSKLISVCGEKYRYDFFSRQRRWVDQMPGGAGRP